MTEPILSTQDVWNILRREPTRPWTVKQICTELGLSHAEKNLKNVSNRCGHIREAGNAERIAQGTYVLIEKGNPMTYTETTYPTEPIEPAFKPVTPYTPAVAADANPMQCPECKFVARSEMGLKAHITRSHSTAKLNADEVFERVATATRILFPDPEDVYSHLEEIAALRKDMLKAITRR